MRARTMLLSSIALGLALPAAPAIAQDESDDEIVVTARKRQESILKVPVVATVFDQESLEKYQTHDIHTLAARTPGLVLGSNISAIGVQAVIRGIGTNTINPTADNSVSLNIDGLQLSQGLAYKVGMFDVAQIEVLKGPQALFYGKNSPGGVISLRSADPTNEVELIARAGYEFVAQEKLLEFIISGPVAQGLKLRLAAQVTDGNGYFKNRVDPITPGGFVGVVTPTFRDFPERNWIVRGTALFNPSANYDARLKINYTRRHIKGNSLGGQLGYCPEGVAPNTTTIQFINPSEDCKIDNEVRSPFFDPRAFPGAQNGGEHFNKLRQFFGTFEQNFHIGEELTLTSVTGLYKSLQDDTWNSTMIQGAAAIGAGGTTFRNEQMTQELRLTSDYQDSPINFTVGAFYQAATIRATTATQGNILLSFPVFTQSVRHKVGVSSVSMFGQLIWNVTPQLEVAAGARWTHEERDHKQFNVLTGQFAKPPIDKISSSNISPDISLTYRPTDDVTVFASYRQGFKSGSFNTASFTAPPIRTDFGDEATKGFEVGLKSRLIDRQLTLNLAAYRYRISGLQVGSVEINSTGGFVVRTVNAAAAKIKGVDFDISYAPRAVRGLSLNAAVNYNDAKYSSFPNAPCVSGQTIAQGCNQLFSTTANRFTAQDLTGVRLIRAPKWNINFGFDYEMPVGNDWTLSLGSSTTYSSKYFNNITILPGYTQPSFFKTNANIALKAPNDRWEIALIGNNLTDKVTTGFCAGTNVVNGVVFPGQLTGEATNGLPGNAEAVCLADRGREVWLRLSVKLK